MFTNDDQPKGYITFRSGVTEIMRIHFFFIPEISFSQRRHFFLHLEELVDVNNYVNSEYCFVKAL